MCSVNQILSKVPTVDITNSNFSQLWPSVLYAISTSSFVALDIELSGLGQRKALMAKSVEDRYKTIRDVARSRSIISMGLSCYRHDVTVDSQQEHTEDISSSKAQRWMYFVQTFNITVLCTENYVVEPESLQFLVQHEFDFNKQYSKGVPYVRGNDSQKEIQSSEPSIRKLFLHLLQSQQSIIIHNGLVDLVFLYHNLYAELPTKLSVFLADIHDMFKGGIYDTKYIAEFKLRYTATYLEYVFRKMLRFNASQEVKNALCLSIKFPTYESHLSFVEYCELGYFKQKDYCKSDICERFANHGWCPDGNGCTKCHNVNIILDVQEKTATKKRKRNRKGLSENLNATTDDAKYSANLSDNVAINETTPERRNTSNFCDVTAIETPVEPNVNKQATTSTHRASYDAFMTGFIVAVYLTTVKPTPERKTKFLLSEFQGKDELVNRLFLSGKEYPLVIQQSNFTTLSKEHQKKISTAKKC